LNRRRRTQQLAEAGLTLFLERGIEPVTVDEIAAAAGTAKGNFYRYFRGKTALVQALLAPVGQAASEAVDRCAQALEAASGEQDLFEAYRQLARHLAAAMLAHPRPVRLYLQERRAPAVGARLPVSQLAEGVEQGAVRLTHVAVQHGLLRMGDPRVTALAVVGATEELALAVLQGQLDTGPDEVATTLIGLVLEGLRVR
jgi:AcrR family transcriptional regulator